MIQLSSVATPAAPKALSRSVEITRTRNGITWPPLYRTRLGFEVTHQASLVESEAARDCAYSGSDGLHRLAADDAEREVCDVCRVDDAYALQRDLVRRHGVKKAGSVAEKHGDEMEAQFIK